MKNLKLILFLFISATILSCSDSEEPPFELTNTNIAGIYNFLSITSEEKKTTISANTVVNISKTKSIGDTFQVTFLINLDGSYSISGQYRNVLTTTPNGGNPVELSEILNLNTSGSYQINTTNNVITFNPISGEFIEGVFDIINFKEDSLIIKQGKENNNGEITTTKTENISLIRK